MAMGLAAVPLAGCGALSALGDASTPLEIYELRVPEPQAPARRALPLDLVVEVPSTGGALATDRIMIRPGALQAEYLPGVRWPDPAPEMLQTLMLRTLIATGGLRYVGRRPLGASGDYAIVTELTDFQAESAPDTEAAAVRLRMIARLVREEDARIVASRSFAAEAPAPSTEPDAVIAAFDRAATQMLADFAGWVLGALGARA